MTNQVLQIKTNNKLKLLEIKEDEGFLKLLQKAVGGYVEHVQMSAHLSFYINEEGTIHGMPPNFGASFLFTNDPKNAGVDLLIFGNAVLCTHGPQGEVVGLPEVVIEEVYRMFRQEMP